MTRLVSTQEWLPKDVAHLERNAWDVVRSEENALIVAGPGAGKTETLAQRASFLLETGSCEFPKRILAISFKRDAASNLKERVARRCGGNLALRFESHTFDAWAKSLLDRFLPALPDVYRPTVDYVLDWKVNNDAALETRLLAIGPRVGFGADQIHQIKISQFYRQFIRDTPLSLEPAATNTQLHLAQEVWRDLLFSGQRSILDFAMIGALAELILRQNPKLLAMIRATYQYVFLDEFQDTSGNQFNLLTTAFKGTKTVISAVGDNKQRIMLWAGARRDVFEAFEDIFSARPFTLNTNYRSAPNLIRIQNHLIEQISPGKDALMHSPPERPEGGECKILVFDNESDEADVLSRRIATWICDEAIPPNEICILVRQTPYRYVPELKRALADYGVAIRAQDELQDLLSEPLTKAIVNFLSVVSKPSAPDEWAAFRDEVSELNGIDSESSRSRSAADELSRFIEESRNQLSKMATAADLRPLLLTLVSFLGALGFRQHHERYIQDEFFNKTFNDCCNALVDAFDRRKSLDGAIDDFLGIGSIPVMSIHKSKGLEFHTIIFLGLEDFPFRRGLAQKNGEEDCNIFVAFSRAKERVIITTSDQRFGFAQSRNEVRRFLNVFSAAGVKAARPHRS